MSNLITPCPQARKCGGLSNAKPRLCGSATLEAAALRAGSCILFGKVLPIIGMKEPTHYRNKVQAAFGLDQKKRIISGVYQSSSHRIVPVDQCMIEDQQADAIIVTIRSPVALLPDPAV